MWRPVLIGLAACLAGASVAWAQDRPPEAAAAALLNAPPPVPEVAAPTPPAALPAPAPPPAAEPPAGADLPTLQEQLAQATREVQQLKAEQAAQPKAADDKQTERLQKQIEVLEKQVEVLQRMIRLLADRVEKATPGAAGTAVATLQTRSEQAARRDQELAYAVDDLREHADAEQRWGPQLPWTLKQ